MIPNIHFKVDDVLHQHKKSASSLIEASGLAKTTVYNIINNKAKAVELTTLGKLLMGLREITSQDLKLTDILEEEEDWREAIFRQTKPFSWQKLQAELAQIGLEDDAKDDDFIDFLENYRTEAREASIKQDQRLLKLFADTEDPLEAH
ncbi:MAG: helix-turn-helix transcriptional regulator [Deinococcales bacterium]